MTPCDSKSALNQVGNIPLDIPLTPGPLPRLRERESRCDSLVPRNRKS